MRLAVLTAVVAMVVFVQLWTAHAENDRVPSAIRRALVPGSDALAWRYRPVLFLDDDERFAPLDIAHAIAAKQVEMCRKTIRGESCDLVTDATLIDQNADYLNFNSLPLGPGDSTGGDKSAYYYHVVDEPPARVYIDYWWFFAENPNPVASAVFCRAGLRGPGVSCFQHRADWEGITVVLAPCDEQRATRTACVSIPDTRVHSDRRVRLVQVNYAQHSGVKRYPWSKLEREWRKRGISMLGERPLVYVALSSHASYPLPCPRGCGREESYDGLRPWDNNGSTDQKSRKEWLTPLPVDEAGDPALWNAFPGPWGGQNCILAGAYCDGSGAPRAPSFQKRYDKPG